MKTRHIWSRGTVALAVISLGACAVPSARVTQEADTKTSVIQVNQMAAAAIPVAPAPLKRLSGNFLGSQPMASSNSLALPANVRDVVINSGSNATGSLQDVADLLRKTTGLSVRINQDVQQERARPAGGAAPIVAALPPGMPGGPLPVAGLPGVPGRPTRSGELPLTFSGDLNDYLNMVASSAGISWEYANNEIHFFRYLTRIFSMQVSPGSLTYRDDVSSQGGATSGGSGSTTQAATFGSSTQAGVTASYSPWDAIKESVTTMVTKEGKFTVNQSSGTLVVTDTREAVERIARWVEQENGVLTRQVSIEVREIAVEITNGSQVGVDLALVYSKLNAVTGSPNWAFKFGAPATLTDSAVGTAAVNIARPDSRFSGSNIAIKALNSFGTVVMDSTRTILTTNRVAGRLQDVTDRAYLAETTPAAGGLTGTGAGVPGLKPGVVTYGDNLTVIPTIGDNNTVLLQLFSTRSTLLSLDSVSSGTGQTFQQINTPALSKKKNSQNFQMTQGETLVIVGNSSDSWTGRDQHSVAGGSMNNAHKRILSVLMVTPRILQGS